MQVKSDKEVDEKKKDQKMSNNKHSLESKQMLICGFKNLNLSSCFSKHYLRLVERLSSLKLPLVSFKMFPSEPLLRKTVKK